MRDDTAEETISDWHAAAGRHRQDAFAYVPAEIAERFKKQLQESSRQRNRRKTQPRGKAVGKVRRDRSGKGIRLATA
jgi:hypothetical protein